MLPLFLLTTVLAANAAATVAPTIETACPNFLLRTVNSYYIKVHEGSCFYFAVYRRRTYDDARVDCRNHGGTLALPKTKAINDFLTEQLSYYYTTTEEVWIGLHDRNSEGKFEWADRTVAKWTNFAEHNGPGNNWWRSRIEDCVAIDPLDGGLWHDFQCNSGLISWVSGNDAEKMYICQITRLVEESTKPAATGDKLVVTEGVTPLPGNDGQTSKTVSATVSMLLGGRTPTQDTLLETDSDTDMDAAVVTTTVAYVDHDVTQREHTRPDNNTTEGNTKPASNATEGNTKPVSDATEGNTKPVTDATEESNTKPVSDATEEGNTKPVSDATEGNTKPVSDATEGNTKPVSDTTEGNTKPVSDATEGNTTLFSELITSDGEAMVVQDVDHNITQKV